MRRLLRGDTAMWVLTKMAMLFFIASLAAILVVFTGYLRTGLCNEEARAIATRVATGLTQVLNTAVEDERRVIQLETALSLGEGRKSRYTLSITRRFLPSSPPTKDFNALLIRVSSEADASCSAGTQVTYPKNFDDSDKSKRKGELTLIPATAADARSRYYTTADNNEIEAMTFRPSSLKPEHGQPSTFVTLVKCTEKKVSQKKFYFIQDCTQRDSTACINLNSAEGGIKQSCGFG